ncbi:hypothetical protein Ae168Ps1_6356 [Pseudonocardia sp. Ae168_Ps1]|uniref:nuclear transport factor 2 family protein n=1 Tax=unclassified Pseudonocardia TaxID=2619320 RepID=UPI00094B29EF|nr:MULTISPECIES: nuclear transport factor 2 family protein [unclassified Pseudonocardia]OLL69901.1 hypothetical protein Ae150APs1_6211c [Pseudonocardia sp. Ae150A_Ps1]OLL70119.1 hypothetical protein Ae168Ps1_6356 [Pseudonocardia sp. Ae168_Ps1]OLL70390.1 hypothetical protein Ae263Ps1_6334 [Pseudonocardia sp. Ae263_Ps1]OLL89171.1 hypothetical protein Ae356Ps1_6199 [Pseudonocardia sp. Ae356_Ps1]
MFEALAGALAAREWDTAAELYAEDVQVTNRFDPDGPVTKTGRAAVRDFFVGLGSKLDSLTIERPTLYPGSDPEYLTAEFDFAAIAGGGAAKFTLPAVFILRVRDGLIIESRDYIGPRQS